MSHIRARFPLRRRSSLSGIMVNGVPWTGPVYTLGSNKQLTAITQISGLPTQCLILVYPGTYAADYWYPNAHRCHIRGMGTSPGDVVFTCSSSNTNGFCLDGVGSYPAGADFFPIMENVRFGNSNSARAFMAFNGGNALFNKCYLACSSYTWCAPISAHWSPTQTNGKIVARNCYLERLSGYMISDCDLSKVRIEQCQLNNTMTYYSCSNSLAVADYVTVGTQGYGFGYGDFLITGV